MCRELLLAELGPPFVIAFGVPTLQWGRDQLIAELSSNSSDQKQSMNLLQWGREQSFVHIILVVVGPVELDLLPFIGNRINAFFVTAEREEISLLVVASEKAVETREDLAFERRNVHCGG